MSDMIYDSAEARRLLEVWYGGTSTPQENARLAALADAYCTRWPESGPDDNDSDLRLVRELSHEADMELQQAEVPEDLEQAVRARIHSAVLAENGRRNRRMMLRRISVAASVAVIALAGAFLGRHFDTPSIPDLHYAATVASPGEDTLKAAEAADTAAVRIVMLQPRRAVAASAPSASAPRIKEVSNEPEHASAAVYACASVPEPAKIMLSDADYAVSAGVTTAAAPRPVDNHEIYDGAIDAMTQFLTVLNSAFGSPATRATTMDI